MLVVPSPTRCAVYHIALAYTRSGDGVPVFPMAVSMTTSVNIAVQIIRVQLRYSVKFAGKYRRHCLL